MVKSEILAIGLRNFFSLLLLLLRETVDPAGLPLSLHYDAACEGRIAKARFY
ncbi:TPA: hypothetical protein QDB05_001723 [Burkholderia vietnamiensis]|nr:hypothetical protein [Burkholderia vietnamiensis]